MTGDIVCLTPNPAIDITYEVAELVVGTSHRVRRIIERPGGKGVNVARVLSTIGAPARIVVPAGGRTGDRLVGQLRDDDLDVRVVRVAAETRRTVTVVDRNGRATALNEAGPQLTDSEWTLVKAALSEALETASVLVISGSLPTSTPAEIAAAFVEQAHVAGVPVIVDMSGPALLAAVEAGPDLVKPNVEELIAVQGEDTDRLAAARSLASRGAAHVVVSCGGDGMIAIGPDEVWHVSAVAGLTGNPTGAGDAVVAALAAGLARGTRWPRSLVEASALGGAAVLAPAAGEVSMAAFRQHLSLVTAERVE